MSEPRKPKRCPSCGIKGHVVDVREEDWWVRRRRECRACNVRWDAWEMLINPNRLTPKKPAA